jgi:hypothetical protein
MPGLLQAAPDAALALLFVCAWIAPTAGRPELVQHLMLVMLLEFIIIHSSAFMGSLWVHERGGTAALGVLGLGAFYTLFVGGFALAFHTWWPIGVFWGLTLNRLLPILLGQAPRGEEAALLGRSWATHALLYLLGVGLTVVLPVPRLGLTPDVVGGLHLIGSGLWVSQPWRLIAFGALYFGGVAVSGAYGHTWLKGTTATTPKMAPAQPALHRLFRSRT